MRIAPACVLASIALLSSAGDVRADETQLSTSAVDLDKDGKKPEEVGVPATPAEAPPPRPYRRTVVLDSSIGVMAFLGDFGKVAPPGPWLHTQLGVELFKWLMLFGEGDLAFTDTSLRQAAPKTRAFPIFGFGGGTRLTVRFTERAGIYAQGSVGAMQADIAQNALGLIGFREAESLAPYLAGRLGLEWYQVDRHLGLGLNGGVRDAQGFARLGGRGALPLVVDGGASIRYAF